MHRAGLKTLVLPKNNKKDLEDIPSTTKKDIKFVFVERLDEVLRVAMKKWSPVKTDGKRETYPRPTYLAAN